MTKIFFVRHGETVWNKELKYQGHTDTQLSDAGLRQAQLVAARLANEKITAVYASDLSRAFTTAQAIAHHHSLDVSGLTELREVNFGHWEGLTYEGINEQWPTEYKLLFTTTDDVRIPGGETFGEVKERAAGAVAKLVERHPDETIVVVSHGGTIRTVICAALNIHLNDLWSIRQDNTAVNVIEYHPERAIVTLLNDIHHLAPAEEKPGLVAEE